MRKRTVRSGLRLMTLSVILLLLGSLYAQQLDALFAVADVGAASFIGLAFFWSAILGTAAVLIIAFGLLQRSLSGENIRLLPALFILVVLITIFITLIYRYVSSPPPEKPLQPGEMLII